MGHPSLTSMTHSPASLVPFRASTINRDVRHALSEFVVPESAPGGASRQADGGAGRVCRARRRATRLCGHRWPMSWTESPVFQQVYGARGKSAGAPSPAGRRRGAGTAARRLRLRVPDRLESLGAGNGGGLDARWVREPRLVRVTGYGPLFDEGAYEADGHIRIDFGSDAPFLGRRSSSWTRLRPAMWRKMCANWWS